MRTRPLPWFWILVAAIAWIFAVWDFQGSGGPWAGTAVVLSILALIASVEGSL